MRESTDTSAEGRAATGMHSVDRLLVGAETLEDPTSTDAPTPSELGRFAVLRRVGAGGMGVVYAAYDERLDRRVAIKLLHPDRAPGAVGRARLVREAQAMARLSHPNVVHVYEVGEHDGQIYVVMEFVQGRDLRDWVDDRRPWTKAVDAYVQAGRGLAAAHAASLVHRDFKPGNIMITDDGRVKVLDFGLARGERLGAGDDDSGDVPVDLVESFDGGELLTRPGLAMGTPGYMAREVLRGSPADARSDQFSFCVSLFEAVYGQRPYGGAVTPASLARVVSGEVPTRPSSNAPAWLHRVISRGLAPEPEQRYPSMDALLAEVERHRTPSRRPLGWVVATGAVVLGAVGLTWAVSGDGPCPEDAALLDEQWGAQRRAQVQTAFAGVVGEGGITTLATVERTLDDYSGAWMQMHHDACLATHVRGEQSERLLDLRMACLRRQQRQLGGLTRVLGQADRDLVLSAPRALRTLPSVEHCADVAALETSVEEPPPADEAERVETARDLLYEVDALHMGGQYRASVQRGREAAALVAPLTYAPVRVEVDRAVAAALFRNEDHDEAIVRMESTFFGAIAIDHQEVAIIASIDLVLLALRQAKQEQAVRWSRHARALIDALPSASPRHEVNLLVALAQLDKARGRLDEVGKFYEQARELIESTGGPDDPRLARVLAGQSALAMWQGRWQDALAANKDATALYESIYGPMHPATIKQRANIGFALLKSGEVEEAKEVLQDAMRDAVKVGFDSDAALAGTFNNVGGVYERLGETDVARDYFERAYSMRRNVLGPEHPLTAHPLNNIGNSYFDDGRLDEALDYYQRALTILEIAHGPDHLHVSFPVVGLARIAYARGRWEDAVDLFERVVTIRVAAGSSPESIAEARFDRAKAMWELPAHRDDALTEATAALAQVDAAADTSVDLETLREDIHQWLAVHRPDAVSPGN
ncbi:MAG: serine/threonine-protein kinase [Deltaproteobacteria bacterium]|nr:serine/threonine-protein kinase [Deltaproteobacteria bacterium]